MRKRAYRSRPPEETVILMGCSPTWTEATFSRQKAGPTGFYSRDQCPVGCRFRDLDRERRAGMKRICLRCLTSTDDPGNWRYAIPLVVAVMDAKARSAKFKAARREARSTLGLRRFGGRKAAKARPAG